MNRRNFIQQASAGAAILSLPGLPQFAKNTPMGIVSYSYTSRWDTKTDSKKYPAFSSAVDLLDRCKQLGGGGIQIDVKNWTTDFAGKVRDKRESLGLYLEGSIGLPKKAEDVAAFEQAVARAREAGAGILRTVCSSGRRYETYHSAEAFQDMKKNALASIQLAEPILRKYKVKLAVENHKDWRAKELVTLLQRVSSEWVGATIDFGNNISLLEDPMEVVQTLAPYAFTTHIKDMGLEEYPNGFLLSEVALGKGILDIPKMVEVCRQKNPAVTFNLEMITRDPLQIPCLTNEYWETFADLPATDLARTLRTARQQKANTPLPRISQLDTEGKLAAEEANIVACLAYSKEKLGLG